MPRHRHDSFGRRQWHSLFEGIRNLRRGHGEQDWESIFRQAEQQYHLRPGLLSAIAHQEAVHHSHNNPLGISPGGGGVATYRTPAQAQRAIFHQAFLLSNPNGPYRNFVRTGNVDDLARVYSPVGARNDIYGTNATEGAGIRQGLAMYDAAHPTSLPAASPTPTPVVEQMFSAAPEPELSATPIQSATPGEMPSQSDIIPPFSESPTPPPSSDIYQGDTTSPVEFGPAPGESIYNPSYPEAFSTPTDFSVPDSGITPPMSDAFIPSDFGSPSAFIPQSVNFQPGQADTSQAPYAAAPPDISMSPFDPNEIMAVANQQMFGPGEMPNDQSAPNDQSMFDAASVSGNDPSYQSGPSNQTIYDPYASPFLGGFDPGYQSPDFSADPVISPGVSSPFSDAMLLPGALSGIGQGGGGNLGSYDAGSGIWGGNNPLTPENFQNLVGWENYQGNALQGAQFYPGQTPGPVIYQPTAGGNYGNYLSMWNGQGGSNPGFLPPLGDFNQISHSGMTFAR